MPASNSNEMKRQKKQQGSSRIIFSVEERDIVNINKKKDIQNKTGTIIIVLALIWVFLYFGSLVLRISFTNWRHGGFYTNRPSHYIAHIQNLLTYSYNLFFDAGPTGSIEIEYCRVFSIALAGAALAVCGAVFQGTFRNVLAGPSTMGVMSGGSLGAMIYLLFFFPGTTLHISQRIVLNNTLIRLILNYQQELFVLAGCFFSVALILMISLIAGRGRVSSSTMVIAGMVFSGVISNVVLLGQYWITAKDPYDGRIEDLRMMMMGNFANTLSMDAVAMMGIPILIFLIILSALSGKLNIMSFGMDEASAMGLNVNVYRTLTILSGTVLTAMVVSFCGRIGFVGFMVPLIVRRLIGPDLKTLIPVSIFAGAIFLTVIYDVACIFMLQDNISVVTGPIGCAVMMVALFRKGGGRNADRTSVGASGNGIR